VFLKDFFISQSLQIFNSEQIKKWFCLSSLSLWFILQRQVYRQTSFPSLPQELYSALRHLILSEPPGKLTIKANQQHKAITNRLNRGIGRKETY